VSKRDLITRMVCAGLMILFFYREFGVPGGVLSFAAFATLSVAWIMAKRLEAPKP